MDADHRAPEPVDLHVGAMLRKRRRSLGMSQEMLATALGVTAQQVQKYETAGSRISASKLFEAAQALSVRASYFFEDLDAEAELGGADMRSEVAVFLECPEGLEMASVFPRIEDPNVRKQFLGLARAMATPRPETRVPEV